MKSFLLNHFLKIILFFLFIILGYYFFFLRPQLILPQAFFKAKKSFTLHRTNLLQNRLALIELTHLNSASSQFTQEKSQLLNQLQTTNQQGLKNIKNQSKIKGLLKFPQTLTRLLDQHQTLLQNQQTLINQLNQLDSLPDQIKLIKSPTAITLLTQQTNLILQYDYWLKQINQRLKNIIP